MTNEKFITALKLRLILCQDLEEHAKKLVAVAEAAKILAYNNECLEYIHNLQHEIENLERE